MEPQVRAVKDFLPVQEDIGTSSVFEDVYHMFTPGRVVESQSPAWELLYIIFILL